MSHEKPAERPGSGDTMDGDGYRYKPYQFRTQ